MNMGMVEFKIEPVLLQKTQIHVVYLSVVLPCILLHSFHTQGCSFYIVKESNKNQNISNITEKKPFSTHWVAFAFRKSLLAYDC